MHFWEGSDDHCKSGHLNATTAHEGKGTDKRTDGGYRIRRVLRVVKKSMEHSAVSIRKPMMFPKAWGRHRPHAGPPVKTFPAYRYARHHAPARWFDEHMALIMT